VRRLSGQSDVVDDKENELVPVKVDPQIEKDIEELSKLRESGAASVILKDLQRRKSEEQVLDPRSASRTPSAAAEPYYRTRYESPIFACQFVCRYELLRPTTRWRCPSVCLFVCHLKCVLVGHWPDWSSSAIVLAAMSSRSAAGPVRPVTDILMVVGAYHVGHSGHTDLLCICLKILTSSNRQSRLHISQFWSEKRILHSLAVSS